MALSDRLAAAFDLAAHDTDLRTEVLAGLTTFLTMSYIVVVNPAILVAAIDTGAGDAATMQMLAVVTALSAGVATLVMAVYANRPFGLAPGMGLNAFFAFTVVGAMGVPWETALAAIVVEGVLFVLLTLVGAREYVIRLFPEPVKFAVGAALGLFLAIIGLEKTFIVVADPSTLLTLGAVASDPVAILSVLGLFLTFGLYVRGVTGSIVVGVAVTSVLGWAAAALGVASPHESVPLAPSLPAPTWDVSPLVGAFLRGLADLDALAFTLVVLTFFFVDFLETAGTLVGVGQAGGFLDENGDLPEMEKPLMADAVGTTVGGMLGTSTVTTYVESATGIEEGGRTGLTALVVALCFFVAVAFVPFAAAIPQYASHIALVVVAVLMLGNVAEVDWHDPTHAVPAGLTVIVMPFTYSIAYGIAAGVIAYPVMKAFAGERGDVHLGQWALAVLFAGYFVLRTGGVLGSV
ncbi:AGZA family xanthine/uracil permease-like MFS transporter [Halarchaeum rubridurum]|uniref:Uracil permease n=1 Tax=Halarchaeum rubridurum TaxID=489911 RepID=A0A830FWU4_9EURY|nr:NCS2 family permease [Halarchaeum rubridurum]MBP1953781.1 AGZA family xanthine/uracil permease-like MFS transporter [Halarchaeum rubridurum]GGM54641.1 uracil permease [Halarchaeum rubridurum]